MSAASGGGAPGRPARVVSFSGGLGSWYAARRVRAEHGIEAMTLLHTDAGTEDQETYAFLIEGAADVLGVPRHRVGDLSARALDLPGVEEEERHDERHEKLRALADDAEARLPRLVWTTQGKDVFDVYREERFLGNSRIDPCSRVLKREASRSWIENRFAPEEVVIYVGIDHTERRRHEQIAGRWAPYPVVSPLCEPPFDPDPKAAQMRACEEAGMNVPRLYRLGFSHGNCSGFCVPYSTLALTPRGWRGREDLKVGDTIMGYDPRTRHNAWTTVEEIHDVPEAEVAEISNKRFRFASTWDHRWYGERRASVGSGATQRRFRKPAVFTTATFGSESHIRTAAPCLEDGGSPVTPDEAALVAWLITDGSVRWSPLTGRTNQKGGERRRVMACLYQSKAAGVAEIRSRFASYVRREGAHKTCTVFDLHPQPVREIWEKAGLDAGREDWAAFVLSLSPDARRAFLDAAWEAEGYWSRQQRELTQNEGPVFEALLLAAYLVGYTPKVRPHVESSGAFESDKLHKVLRLGENPFISGAKSHVRSVGSMPVWCVTTGLGSWVARQEDCITVTGNCCKAGKGHFALLLRTMPERYRHFERQEQALRDHLGKDYTILREQRDKTRYGITLRELRERVEAGGRP